MSLFDSETHDAKIMARKFNFVPEGFRFGHIRQDQKKSDGTYVVRFVVLVTCNNKTAEYQGGQNLNWLAEFEGDLRSGRWGAINGLSA